METWMRIYLPEYNEEDTSELLLNDRRETRENFEELLFLLDAEIRYDAEARYGERGATLIFDLDAVKKKLNRKAGRRRKKYNPNCLTTQEVMKRLEEHTAEEVAHELEISRGTLFRKLKDIKRQEEIGIDTKNMIF